MTTTNGMALDHFKMISHHKESLISIKLVKDYVKRYQELEKVNK